MATKELTQKQVLGIAISLSVLGGAGVSTGVHFATTPSRPPSNPASWSVPYWAFDPANASGCASDSNTCTSASCSGGNVGPCSTLSEIYSRWTTTRPVFTSAVTVQQLSDDAAPWPNAVSMPNGPTTIIDWFSTNGFLFEGTLLPQASATIGTYTALNRTAGTLGSITAQGQSGAFWTPYVGMMVQDLTTPAVFWVVADLGSATANITTPMVPVTVPTFQTIAPAYVTIANGDSLRIVRPTKALCHDLGSGYGSFTDFFHVWCTSSGAGFTSTAAWFHESVIDNTVTWLNCQPTNGSNGTYVVNSYSAMQGTFEGAFVGGALASPTDNFSFGCPYAPSYLDGDIVVVSARQHINWNTILNIGRAYLGNTNFHTYSSGVQIRIGQWDSPGFLYPDAEIWGPASIDVSDGAYLICEQNCTANILVKGDMSFEQSLTTGYPWSVDAGAFQVPQVALTPANVDAVGAICSPQHVGECFYSHQLP